MMKLSDVKKSKGLTWIVEPDELFVYRYEKDRRIKCAKDLRSYQDADGIWHIFPFAWDGKRVYICCPLCGFIHIHGGSPEDYAGDREPHCHPGDVPFYVLDMEK